MKVKLFGNDILCDEFIPSLKIGEFNNECTPEAKKLLMLDMKFGREFVETYENVRDNLHIMNVANMIDKMERLFREYDKEKFRIKRNIL